ncbi:metallophosphoesterase family protein [Calditerrivibrio nitroreducens]|uniref:Phosphoesterase n=1 Tax=Calditerrivibrio nitroreducens (strain DSM 19672 / NBRC 101217 / Yu37-1) TaxID=768670 RepID=E4TG73_CALNY|nr:metallophosphoesterase [Calditerrivibrio nitroreducens]ADR19660.1 phosphodiesterase, MJ0936 family [Calditerrivibrio nitroreducens DSM 19672]
MRILIISDTHIYSIKNLPPQVLDEIPNSDAVIHAGDIVGIKAYNELKEISKRLYAVKGNIDLDIEELEDELIFQLGKFKIGLTHGHKYNNLYNGLIYNFSECDIVVFGHLHSPYFGREKNLSLINPGSTSKNRWKNKNSYAIMDIYENDFKVTFVDIS